jgi:UDPglucose 6-dehydrogenase
MLKMICTYERVSVVGLGKLGLCLAACLAEGGFETLGVDIEERVVQTVGQGRAPWFEPGLDDLLARNVPARLRTTTRHADAIEQADVTIVLVATPSNPDGSFSNRFVESALRSLAQAFGRSNKKFHSFVISSTVMPGSIEESFIPIIEKHSGRRLHQDFSVCYDPDFVALGNVIRGFREPDLVVIGESDPDAGARQESLHHKLCINEPKVSHMSLISAEVAKVCLNAYITMKISFANSVGNLCERIPGSDVDAITNAIGADRRISPYYFQAGLSFGGTCFPRDTFAYTKLASKFGVQHDLLDATKSVNKIQDEHLANLVLREVGRLNCRTVAIVGLAFTPGTAVITESPAVKLIDVLLQHDVRVIVTDPLAIDNARARFGSALEYMDTPAACLGQCELALLLLRDKKIKSQVESFCPSSSLTLIDAWRMIDPSRLDPMIRLIRVGRHSADNAGAALSQPSLLESVR